MLISAASSHVSGGNFADFGIHLAVDVVAVLLLASAIYYRRHGRRDLVTCIVCFNISLFIVLAVIDVRTTSLGVGFGLFALLSIISLRSDPFSTIELGYFFSGIVIGVVNALDGSKVTHRRQVKTPDDDIHKFRAAKVPLKSAIGMAVDHATNKGKLTSLEIDTTDSGTISWQISFGGDKGTAVVLNAKNGKVINVGQDAG